MARGKNLQGFEKDLDDFSKQIRVESVQLQKAIAFQFLRRIVEVNPVGDPTNWKGYEPGRTYGGYVGGTSRSNWQVSVNIPALDTQDNIISEQAVVDRGNVQLAQLPPYRIVWITNNMPYINRILEEGWSSQAPPGTFTYVLQTVKLEYGIGI